MNEIMPREPLFPDPPSRKRKKPEQAKEAPPSLWPMRPQKLSS